ncbi:MAG TPA: hypothetical protein VF812_15735 [Ktedonobacterales bacterium]
MSEERSDHPALESALPRRDEKLSSQAHRSWAEMPARQAYVAATASRQRTARNGLAIALIAGLLLISLASALITPHYLAAQRVAADFCDALRGHAYSTAYGLMDDAASGGIGSTAYASAMRALDTAQGPVSACAAAAFSGYTYTPGQDVAGDLLTLTRHGVTYQGMVGLARSGARWRITTVAQTIYGLPLAPVAVAATYCAALRAGEYTTAYTLFNETLQGMQAQADYINIQRLRDTLTGRLTGCAIISLSAPDDQTVNALLSVTRTTGPHEGGELQVQTDGAAWRISQLDPAIQGIDVGPYLTGQRFCAALSANDYSRMAGLLTDTLRSPSTLARLRATFAEAPGSHWRCGQPQAGSYSVTGATASYRVPLAGVSLSGQPAQRIETLTFSLIEGAWQISGY